ncbi:MAG: MmgE/PrpD family protein [Cyclonatronaceae bacterium]
MNFQKTAAQLYDLIGDRAIADRHRILAGRYFRDWFGCYMAGGATITGKKIRDFAGKKPDTEMALFSTSALSKQTGSDDIHHQSMTHPGCVVIPAAMIIGRNSGKSCNDVLDSVIAGYEVMIRMGEGIGNRPRPASDNTAIAGVFASAMVASRLMNAGRDEFVRAMEIASCFVPGEVPAGMNTMPGKNLQAAQAAQSGYRAARLAAIGLIVQPAANGRAGDLQQRFPDASPGKILADASSWRIGETSIKPYPAYRYTQTAIDAVLGIRHHLTDNPFEVIKTVNIVTSDAIARVGDIKSPADSYSAPFSLQYSVCAALLRGVPGPHHFENTGMNEILKHPLMKRIRIETDSTFETKFKGKWVCRLEIEMESGKTYTELVDTPTGDPDRPLSEQELDEKVTAHLLCAGFTREGADVLMKPYKELSVSDGVPDCWWLREDDHQVFMN